jgi:hypothetical protein
MKAHALYLLIPDGQDLGLQVSNIPQQFRAKDSVHITPKLGFLHSVARANEGAWDIYRGKSARRRVKDRIDGSTSGARNRGL